MSSSSSSALQTLDFGKDQVIFVTKEEHALPSNVELPPSERAPGLILDSGEINWNCPCLGGMATGPCGVEFRDAFSCFHYSEETPKGTECFEAFKTMQDCFAQYPAVYDKSSDDGGAGGGAAGDDVDLDAALAESAASDTNVSSSNSKNVESVDQLDEPAAAAATSKN